MMGITVQIFVNWTADILHYVSRHGLASGSTLRHENEPKMQMRSDGSDA